MIQVLGLGRPRPPRVRRRDAAIPAGCPADHLGARAGGHPAHADRRRRGGSVLAAGDIDAVLVGADRIAANGDTANKIGTYPLAVLAARHGVPFYVARPYSSRSTLHARWVGDPDREPAGPRGHPLRGRRVAPGGTAVFNPAFDITPAELVTAIVTEEGVLRPPYGSRSPGRSQRELVTRARTAARVISQASTPSVRRQRRAPGRPCRHIPDATPAPASGVADAGRDRGGDDSRLVPRPGRRSLDRRPIAVADVPRAGSPVRCLRDLRSRRPRVQADPLGRGLRRRRAGRGGPRVPRHHPTAPVRDGQRRAASARSSRRDPTPGSVRRRSCPPASPRSRPTTASIREPR